MVITCPSCSERYRLSPDKIKGKGAKITCPSCSHLFLVLADGSTGTKQDKGLRRARGGSRSDAATRSGAFAAVGLTETEPEVTTTSSIRVVAPGPRGAQGRKQIATIDASGTVPVVSRDQEDVLATTEQLSPEPSEEENLRASDLDFREVGIVTWKVKVAIGLVYDFSDIMTLKKYLADKKVTPDDLISHNGKSWVRIGDVDDLDQHFVDTWKAARNSMKAEERPAAKKKPEPSAEAGTPDEESKYSSPAKSSSMEAAEEVAAMRKKRSQRRRDEATEEARVKRNRTFAFGIAAILLIGGLSVAYLVQRNQAAELAAIAEQAAMLEANATAAENVQKDDEENVDAVRARIREVLDRRREEIQAGVLSDKEAAESQDEEPGDEGVQEAIVKARRIPVVPSSEASAPISDSQGFRKPMVRPGGGTRRAPPRTVAPPKEQAVASSKGKMREKRSRDPGRLYYELGRSKLEERNFGAALKSFQKSVDKSPKCGRCWEGLALAHQALGNAQDAAAAFDKAEGLGIPINAARP